MGIKTKALPLPIIPPLLLYYDPQLLNTHALLYVVPGFGHGGATCSQLHLVTIPPRPTHSHGQMLPNLITAYCLLYYR